MPLDHLHGRPATRREFLRRGAGGLGFLAFAPYAPAFLAQAVRAGVPAPERDRRILVLVQLAGGNDGLNTVVPHADDRYRRLRPNLALKGDELIKVRDDFSLHASLKPLEAAFREGQMGIVRDVGYPNPNRSHFRSMEIWETASESEETLTTGWIGRYLDHACAGAPSEDPAGVSIGDEMPPTFIGEDPHPVFSLPPRGGQATRDARLLGEVIESAPDQPGNSGFLHHTFMDTLVQERRVERVLAADRPEADYPATRLGGSLRRIAGLIAARMETRVYFASLGGFDTHANQKGTHARLLGELAGALAAFQEDLAKRGLADQVLTLTFSEFGRRPSENNGGGTDHGTAAPLFLLGTGLATSVHGEAPDLSVRPNQDLGFGTDFRSIYSTVLEGWLGAPSASVLGKPWPVLPLLKA